MNLAGIWQAAYTAGVVLPKPVATATYWHRALQPRKLIAVNFTRLAARPDAQAALWLRPDKSALGKGRLLRTCQQLGVAALGHMRSFGRYSREADVQRLQMQPGVACQGSDAHVLVLYVHPQRHVQGSA